MEENVNSSVSKLLSFNGEGPDSNDNDLHRLTNVEANSVKLVGFPPSTPQSLSNPSLSLSNPSQSSQAPPRENLNSSQPQQADLDEQKILENFDNVILALQ